MEKGRDSREMKKKGKIFQMSSKVRFDTENVPVEKKLEHY